MYELSRLSNEDKEIILANGGEFDDKDLMNGNWEYVWAVSIYYSVLVIGGNEMQPAQNYELMFVVVMNVSGVIFMTWIVGEIAVIVAQISHKATNMQSEIDVMNTAMNNAKLSKPLQAEIRDYFLKVQGTMEQQRDLEEFFGLISDPIREAVQKVIYQNVLKDKNDAISETLKFIANDRRKGPNGSDGAKTELSPQISERLDSFLPSLVQKLGTDFQTPHEKVVSQGDYDARYTTLYFVGKGDCKVTVRNAKGKEVFVSKLNEGDHFGEI